MSAYRKYAKLPGFRDFPPEELAFRNHIFDAWRGVAGRYGYQEYDGPSARGTRALHRQERQRDRRSALRVHRQGGEARRAPARDDALPRPHPRRPQPGAPQADPVVLDPAALPLRAPAARAAPRTLPVECGPRGRAWDRGGCRGARGRDRRIAGARPRGRRHPRPRLRPHSPLQGLRRARGATLRDARGLRGPGPHRAGAG